MSEVDRKKPFVYYGSVLKKFSFAGAFLACLFFLTLVLSIVGCQKKQSSSKKLYNPQYSAEEFDRIARTVFKNIYPYLALQIKEEFLITEGSCLDVGSGPGHLAIELAKITNLHIYALDIDPEAVRLAQKNVEEARLADRLKAVQGDVERMPFSDNSMDLVVSRGSYLFWKDKVKAFQEINRILKPGGTAFIGGGMGNLIPPAERAVIRERMDKEKIGPPKELEVSFEEMGVILRKAGIPNFKVTTDAGCLCGLWVEFKKRKGS
jgi:ubiquinone/menaquinone biosynthesis C-methylase UbiE